ncbi:hypothetical protein ILYODFUR_026060 [Ilyodon furcidens]|uniref:Uncharacterized protein n=1 Tax=Ilyodon furcidens TaxID=33524 RepID=A0ABV0VHN9_9TELE
MCNLPFLTSLHISSETASEQFLTGLWHTKDTMECGKVCLKKAECVGCTTGPDILTGRLVDMHTSHLIENKAEEGDISSAMAARQFVCPQSGESAYSQVVRVHSRFSHFHTWSSMNL